MVNLNKIKNEIKDTMSKLSPDKLAEIYFQDRKRFIKLGMQGEKKKALDLLRRNDNFYKDNYHKDKDLFHKSHHKYLDWYSDYMYFKMLQELIARAKKEEEYQNQELVFIEYIELCIEIYQYSKDEKLLKNILNVVKPRRQRLKDNLNDFPDVIKAMESQIEDNKYFKEHNYFEDVDPLGYKELDPELWYKVTVNQWSNNGPITNQPIKKDSK